MAPLDYDTTRRSGWIAAALFGTTFAGLVDLFFLVGAVALALAWRV